MDNNKNNDFLNELLNKKQKGELDDFEREALEGFDTLSSEETHDLKATIDAHMKEEVFVEKKATRVYWLAAAALALVIGLSVIFVTNNGSNGKDLAITTLQDEIAPEGMNQSPVLSPTAEEKSVEPEKKLDDANKNIKDAVAKAEHKEPGAKSPDAQEQNRNGLGGTLGESQKANGTSVVVDEESKSIEKSAKTDLATNNNSNFKQQGPPSVSVPNPNRDANLELDKLKKEAEKSETSGKKGKADEERVEVRANLAASTAASTKNVTITEDPKKGKEVQVNTNENSIAHEKKKSRAIRKKDTQPILQTENKPGDKFEEAGNDRSEDKDQREAASENVPTSPKTADDAKANDNAGYFASRYTGGETAMKKDLGIKLNEKGLDKKFDAILFVNKSGKVEKVKLVNIYGMDKNDADKIENILRSLDKFDATDKKESTEIKLNYRP